MSTQQTLLETAPVKQLDGRELRNTFGKFASGVTVVTCRNEQGDPHGATISSFTSISLEPALLQVTLIRENKIASLIKDAPFTVNVLGSHQQDLAMHFAGRPQELAPEWVEGATAPALAGVCATFACRPWAEYDGGDHIIVIGEIVEASHEEIDPLLFHSGKFHRLGELSTA